MTALELAQKLVSTANSITILSGAGLSTASGIPDFRGPSGLWTADPDAEKISTLDYYLHDEAVRRKAWQYRAGSPMWDAKPNAGHYAIVELERQGKLRGIITQNTDGLHQVAGSSPMSVHEVHGSVRTWRCETCRAEGPMVEAVQRVLDGEDDPRCQACGGIIRATTILFGEGLISSVLDAAVADAENCDLMIAVGTSLTVQPVSGLVPYAVGHGAKLIIVNGEPTPYDHLADAILDENIATVLPRII